MTARLEHKLDKEQNITELFIDSEDGKICKCILKLERSVDITDWPYRQKTAELQLEMNEIVKAINTGVIRVVDKQR